MPEVQQFLTSLDRGLDRLSQRLRTSDSDCPVVRFLPDTDRAVGRDELAIGTGRFEIRASAEPQSLGICLNDKQAGKILKISPKISSVTDLVFRAPADLQDQWCRTVGNDVSPEAFLERFTLVVEDASPDSCFGVLFLLMRMAGIEDIPNAWVRYIEGWERGEVVLGESVYSDYGCLHNALVHGKVDHDIGGAWVEGLRLMADTLRAGVLPTALPHSIASSTFMRARAFLGFEEQSYKETLNHANCIQLELPMADTESRYRLVDAYLAEQTLPFGSLKAFSRTDRIRPFLKNGFTLMAIYRSVPIGDGDDVVISVDPMSGVTLKDLWWTLERLEDQRWGGGRPCDNPRRDLVGYQDGKRPDGSNGPNQPWYDGRDYSLIASPRTLKDGRPGSKLKWPDVLDALWQTYQPFRHVKVRPGEARLAIEHPSSDDELKSLEACFPEELSEEVQAGDNVPNLFVAGWYRPDSSSPAFHVTPTLCRYLAACIKQWRPASLEIPVALERLPDEGAYDLLELPGSIAIISQDGAFLVHDGQHLKPNLHEMKHEFERAVKVRQRIGRSADDLAKFLDDIRAFFSGQRRDLIEENLLHRLATEQIEIALELHQANTSTISSTAKRFREALLSRWGLAGWLDALANDVTEIKNVLQGKSDLDRTRRIANLYAHGVPAVVAGAIYVVGVGSMPLHGPTNVSTISWSGLKVALSGLNWWGLIVFVILYGLVFGARELIPWIWRRVRSYTNPHDD
jgi:hypothetical protein